MMDSVVLYVILLLHCISPAATESMSEDGPLKSASSISGILVTCYENEEICKKECFFTCHSTDYCNDSSLAKVACVPHLTLIVFLTFAFILFTACCCCCICIGVPILLCYKSLRKWQTKRRNRRMFI
ncbi:hypothetical protein ACH3XW_29135 [Acanthocheilonema viteae]